jgi:hypothetical protein
MEQQLELQLEAIRIQSIDQLTAIKRSSDQIRIDINDLLALADALFARDVNHFVIGSTNHVVHKQISTLLTGRVSEMSGNQKNAYKLMIARLALILKKRN